MYTSGKTLIGTALVNNYRAISAYLYLCYVTIVTVYYSVMVDCY